MAENPGATFAVSLPSDREIAITRWYDAPRDLVFEAFTKPEHLRRWWGPRYLTLPVCDMDFRVGGAYRFVQRGPDGAEYGFRGEYLEIVRPERIASTFEFEGMPGHVAVTTMVFEETGGKTKLMGTTRFESREDRDGMLQSGMEDGARDTYDRLEELLPMLAAGQEMNR